MSWYIVQRAVLRIVSNQMDLWGLLLKKLVISLSAILLGFALGLASVALVLNLVMTQTSIKNGVWNHNVYVGSSEASGYTRAAISIIGFLGMTRDESIYFIAREDGNGELLTGECTYRVDGKFDAEDARWWSITVYNTVTSKLIENNKNRYSFNGDNIELNEDGSFSFRVSAQEQTGNWIPIQVDSLFDLTLRMYNPSETFKNNTATMPLPTLTKEACL